MSDSISLSSEDETPPNPFDYAEELGRICARYAPENNPTYMEALTGLSDADRQYCKGFQLNYLEALVETFLLLRAVRTVIQSRGDLHRYVLRTINELDLARPVLTDRKRFDPEGSEVFKATTRSPILMGTATICMIGF